MNVDSSEERNNISLTWVKRQLRAFSAVAPPSGLRERLLAAIPRQMSYDASPGHVRQWTWAAGWAGVAATIMVLCGAVWLHSPSGAPVAPTPDVNGSQNRVLAADYNSVRPPDINALDSNGLY